jgi:hypothetical protein
MIPLLMGSCKKDKIGKLYIDPSTNTGAWCSLYINGTGQMVNSTSTTEVPIQNKDVVRMVGKLAYGVNNPNAYIGYSIYTTTHYYDLSGGGTIGDTKCFKIHINSTIDTTFKIKM